MIVQNTPGIVNTNCYVIIGFQSWLDCLLVIKSTVILKMGSDKIVYWLGHGLGRYSFVLGLFCQKNQKVCDFIF